MLVTTTILPQSYCCAGTDAGHPSLPHDAKPSNVCHAFRQPGNAVGHLDRLRRHGMASDRLETRVRRNHDRRNFLTQAVKSESDGAIAEGSVAWQERRSELCESGQGDRARRSVTRAANRRHWRCAARGAGASVPCSTNAKQGPSRPTLESRNSYRSTRYRDDHKEAGRVVQPCPASIRAVHRSTIPSKTDASTGFVRKSFIPAAMHAVRSSAKAFAVSATIGTRSP